MKETKELAPKYNHLEVEKEKYQKWLEQDLFRAGSLEFGDISKRPYTIVIPPPNVTGRLHLGHAWDTTLQDIIIRQKRMAGYDALYLPGMDHAGIATQAKVDEKLKKMGISRYDLGREKFLEIAWEWKAEYAEIIRKQWEGLGLSLDYSRERFTLDEGLNNAVNQVFITLFQEGLIYRGERIINWDVQSKTALSNIEVEYQEIQGAFYHFIYPFVDGNGGLEIATTRPETMFGDTAIMVNPKDERYKAFIGGLVYIPGTTRQIPIIADEYVDKEFGTGVVKVTPAHDPNDFEVGNRHNLERPLCMNEDGSMNELAGKYSGQDRFLCRKNLVADLTASGLCPKIEPMIHSVGHSERTGVVVEPRLSKQWFVKMDKLSNDVLKMQEKEGIEFVPERFNKTFRNWMENIQDWCISRQLWWGHRIPAWYKGEEVKVCVNCPGDGWIQDEDVLDTWFSSALWPFSTLGWPEKTNDFLRYYSTNCLVTGYDIIFFWVARMAFQGLHFTGERPFEKCLIHGLIRDEQGRKMSKSLGNGVDPFDLIEKYGCDALRYFLTTNSTPGQDLRYSEEKLASGWNYINKIWNISRYIHLQITAFGLEDEEVDQSLFQPIDNWLITKLNSVVQKVNSGYESFEFGEVAKAIYNFVWDDFASSYLELTKVVLAEASIATKEQKANTLCLLKDVLIVINKLLHPFMPFVTEEIYQIFENGSIVRSDWPKIKYNANNDADFAHVEKLLEIIAAIRNIRAENNVSMSSALPITLTVDNAETAKFLKNEAPTLKRFVNFESLNITDTGDNSEQAMSVVLQGVTISIPMAALVDIEQEISKLQQETLRLENEIKRCSDMLANPNFVNKAPTQKIEQEKAKLTNYQDQLAKVEKLLLSYKSSRKE